MIKQRIGKIAEGILGEKAFTKLLLLNFKRNLEVPFNIVQNNAELHNLYRGQRCFIIGNGPSLKTQDLNLLANEHVFTCNYFPQSNQFDGLKPLGHFFMDDRFFVNEKDLDVKPVNTVLRACHNAHMPYLFLDSSIKKYEKDYAFPDLFETHYIIQSPYASLNQALNLASIIPQFSTVVHTAICVAWYMGFKYIYLLGCDCTGFVSYAKAYEVDCSLENSYGFAINKESNYVIQKNMTSAPIEDELRWYACIFDNYKKLHDFCKQTNRELINLTNGGVLGYLPRAQYEDVIMSTQF